MHTNKFCTIYSCLYIINVPYAVTLCRNITVLFSFLYYAFYFFCNILCLYIITKFSLLCTLYEAATNNDIIEEFTCCWGLSNLEQLVPCIFLKNASSKTFFRLLSQTLKNSYCKGSPSLPGMSVGGKVEDRFCGTRRAVMSFCL